MGMLSRVIPEIMKAMLITVDAVPMSSGVVNLAVASQ